MRTKESVMATLEETRAAYLSTARINAEKLYKRLRRPITVDDVRKVCPPPESIDGRVMGAIFSAKNWQCIGYGKGARKVSHRRPVARFELV